MWTEAWGAALKKITFLFLPVAGHYHVLPAAPEAVFHFRFCVISLDR